MKRREQRSFGIKLDEHVKGLCGLCKKKKFLINHHITYFPEFTIYICRECHSAVHRKQPGFERLCPIEGQSAKYYKREEHEGSNLSK